MSAMDQAATDAPDRHDPRLAGLFQRLVDQPPHGFGLAGHMPRIADPD